MLRLMPCRPPLLLALLTSILLLAMISACSFHAGVTPLHTTQPPLFLTQANHTINHRGRPCTQDLCLADWPEVADLEHLAVWDCKAYAIAKADWLIRRHGYDPARLEYVLVEGPPLRVAHVALLVDGLWVMDSGLRCQVCTLESFRAGLRLSGRLPVTDLPCLRRVLRAAQPR